MSTHPRGSALGLPRRRARATRSARDVDAHLAACASCARHLERAGRGGRARAGHCRWRAPRPGYFEASRGACARRLRARSPGRARAAGSWPLAAAPGPGRARAARPAAGTLPARTRERRSHGARARRARRRRPRTARRCPRTARTGAGTARGKGRRGAGRGIASEGRLHATPRRARRPSDGRTLRARRPRRAPTGRGARASLGRPRRRGGGRPRGPGRGVEDARRSARGLAGAAAAAHRPRRPRRPSRTRTSGQVQERDRAVGSVAAPLAEEGGRDASVTAGREEREFRAPRRAPARPPPARRGARGRPGGASLADHPRDRAARRSAGARGRGVGGRVPRRGRSGGSRPAPEQDAARLPARSRTRRRKRASQAALAPPRRSRR